MIRWMRDNVIVYGPGDGKGAALERRGLECWKPAARDDAELVLWGVRREYHQAHSLAAQHFGADLVCRYSRTLGDAPDARTFTRYLRTEIGYCIDAPEILPAGSCYKDEIEGMAFAMIAMIDREGNELCRTPQHPEPSVAPEPASRG